MRRHPAPSDPDRIGRPVRTLVLAGCLLVAPLAGCHGAASRAPDVPATQISAIHKEIDGQRDAAVAAFYRGRDYRPLWITGDAP
ncbi:MAG: hypothetical protein ACTHMG_04320, partial [Sphingomonas sp.]